MIKVTALTSGKNDASRRFRVRQFIHPLRQLGIEVSEHRLFMSKYRLPPTPWLRPAWGIGKLLGRAPGLVASRFADITWLEREFFPGRSTLERFAGSKRLLDVDDAIWLGGQPNFSEEIAAQCYGVIAGNQFIADHYQKHSERVWVVPTSVDTDRWRPSPKNEKAPWTIGWTGTKSNLEYLYTIEEALADFLARHPDSRLLILCDEKPVFNQIAASQWHFERWSPENEVAVIQQMNVGLMPLPDTEWTRGKCALKMLVYMAAGLPVVVSPVGLNREVLHWQEVGFAATSANDWYDALVALFNNRDLATRLGATGREVVEEHYSVATNAPLLAKIFQEVATL